MVQWHKHQDSDPAIIWMRKLLNTLGAELSGRAAIPKAAIAKRTQSTGRKRNWTSIADGMDRD